VLKDDKSFPFVKLSVQEEWPRLSVTRRVLDDGARYVGPFTDVKALRRTLRDLRRIFPVRTCRNFEDYRRQDRPCLYFHIRRCAPRDATTSGWPASSAKWRRRRRRASTRSPPSVATRSRCSSGRGCRRPW